MTTVRAVAVLAVICSAMAIDDCSDTKEPQSSLPENPFFGRFPDSCKNLNFPFSFPLPPLINSFPPPILSPMLPFPFSKLDFNFPPSLLTPPVPVEEPAAPETLSPAVEEPPSY
ncbi:pollen-specific leucine-rich repeat extensin-like protein 2 [Rhopalosiphum maidis]|uniref:pollen-specific leucine-rich repeat extensin-like protein 2 n=1 Tax=Rhopalosiphum maidis TaxID=43146 RepID=UPI000EFF8906|nr:pollen-specific leucine-rich repeat extensin-like protein 2 [Rhopalosiphum maidis]